ncbi:anti-phage dCTP deaminase [uncultured Sphingomonas sp.]|uniref:anti-phage dCTP deaminase n=1 Tax=uncultured Sphingomonas sp. TaxID=158754 RepID=UPI0026148E49|nr:anti-phage dCTP deaminase [uncultured Sphingomonas sp.]
MQQAGTDGKVETTEASGDEGEHTAVAGTPPTAAEASKPELVIGLVGPIGTDLHDLAKTIEEKLSAFRYRCEQIKVSTLIAGMCDDDAKARLDEARGGARIRMLMAAGDSIRTGAGDGGALVPLIVTAIRTARVAFNKDRNVTEDVHADDACYIVDSLKHPDEIKALRDLYGRGFVLVSAFDSRDARVAKLQRDIAKSATSTNVDQYREEATTLVDIDEKRPGGGIGQYVRDAFPLGDFFIRVREGYDVALGRFLDALFGDPYITPYRGEHHMAEASMAALRSADLSRQIGAVIVDRHGEIVSSGCNDVPMAGGGTYWPDEPSALDNRDHTTGQDFNAVMKFDIIGQLLAFLEKEGLYERKVDGDASAVTAELVTGRYRTGFKELRISNLIEFGRVVHAEMAALMRAAQRGIAIDRSTIYSTTFPCHMCARHIIAAGVTRVVYIEPYPKSMTAELFPESVLVDRKSYATDRPDDGGGKPRPDAGGDRDPVRFDPYEGIAPRLYTKLFRVESGRKDARGYTVKWRRADARPKTYDRPEIDLKLERQVAAGLEGIARVGLTAIGV